MFFTHPIGTRQSASVAIIISPTDCSMAFASANFFGVILCFSNMSIVFINVCSLAYWPIIFFVLSVDRSLDTITSNLSLPID